jgi:hypothetical protein
MNTSASFGSIVEVGVKMLEPLGSSEKDIFFLTSTQLAMKLEKQYCPG